MRRVTDWLGAFGGVLLVGSLVLSVTGGVAGGPIQAVLGPLSGIMLLVAVPVGLALVPSILVRDVIAVRRIWHRNRAGEPVFGNHHPIVGVVDMYVRGATYLVLAGATIGFLFFWPGEGSLVARGMSAAVASWTLVAGLYVTTLIAMVHAFGGFVVRRTGP